LQVTLYDPYLSASEVVFHEEALYQVYVPLPLPLNYTVLFAAVIIVNTSYSFLLLTNLSSGAIELCLTSLRQFKEVNWRWTVNRNCASCNAASS